MRRLHYLLIGLLAASFVNGCVVAREYDVGPPPPDRVEVIGVAPFPDAVWVAGGWGWDERHHRHEWHEGYWGSHRR